jgi:flagellar biosynthesis GTPase FlhF
VALCSAEDEVRAQLTSLPRIDSTTADDDVLRTVCLIIKMGHQARQFSLSAATRAALADRVVAVYPNMMPTQVQQAIDEGLVVRRAQVMGRAALTDYHRSVTSLLSSCESAFLLASLAEGERLEKAAAAQQRNADQANRHARLAEKRASHEAQLRRRRSEAEQQRSAVAAKAEALRAKQAAEFQRRLQLLQAYEAQRALLREKEQALQEAKARAAEEEKAARMKRNEARVDFRRNQEEQRRRERKMQEEEIRSLQLKKQQALERFFASVDKQLGVEADPQRVLKSTSSSAQTESYETLAQATRPSIAGFSDDQIMKDPRVRLYHALLAAGLHTTPYGREVVTRGYRVTPSQMSSENNPLRGEFS